jgi:hypothetical protein
MWCKGVTITGSGKFNDGGDDEGLAGATDKWHMGLIQIIKKQPRMVAKYENKIYYRWFQETIPCYDSDGIRSTPWYNAGARAALEAGVSKSVELRDYPTATTAMRWTNRGVTGRLIQFEKKLEFDTYLAVRPKASPSLKGGLRILHHLEWSTNSNVSITWNPDNDKWSYQVNSFVRTSKDLGAVSYEDSKKIVKKLPVLEQGANSSITHLVQ